jgi:diacylglycerol kinase family enzyme
MHASHYVSRRVGTRRAARLVAAGALVLGALGVLLVVWSILDSPILALLLLLLAPVFLALVFVAVTSDGHRRRLAALGAVAVGVGLVATLVLWNASRDGVRFSGVFGVGALALAAIGARYALTIPPPSLDHVLTIGDEARVPHHPWLIINMKSGGGKAEKFELLQLCREHDIETRVLQPGDELTELALDALRGGADVVGMAGGDGSLAYVASALADHDVPFVCVPAGTRNHFALDLGLDRNDPRQAIAAFLNGEERRIDYATINGRMFLNNVSLGVYAAIVAQDSYRDAKLDTTLQLLPKLVSEGGPWFDLHFDVPGHGHLDEAALLQISNNPYAPAPDIGRRTRLDAGELGIMTADPKRVSDLVGITMLAAAGRADRASALWVWSSPSFLVESRQSQLAAGLDGETVQLEPPLDFRVVPRGLRVQVPRGTRVGLDEQTVGSHGTVGNLLTVALGLEGSDG